MTGTAADVLAAAARVIGQTENPPGSNRCPITDELDATFPRVPLASGGTSTRGGTSWCSSANLWWLWRSGYPVDPRGCLVVNGVDIWCFYTPADVNAWKRAGRWLDWREKPPVGALVFFDWQGTHGTTSLTDHTGIVVDVADDGQITTIEGNTSPGGFVSNGGGVYLFGPGQRSPARPLSTVVGYGLPLYAPDVPLAPGDDDMATLYLMPNGDQVIRGDATPARRVNGFEQPTLVRRYGDPIRLDPANPAHENILWWLGKEIAAYDRLTG